MKPMPCFAADFETVLHYNHLYYPYGLCCLLVYSYKVDLMVTFFAGELGDESGR